MKLTIPPPPTSPAGKAVLAGVVWAVFLAAILGTSWLVVLLAEWLGTPWLPITVMIVVFAAWVGASTWRRERARARRQADETS